MIRLDERGMTLMEVIVAMVVLSVIVGAITTSIFVGLQTTRETSERLTDAVGVSFASAYFIPDVESADTVEKNDVSSCFLTGTPVVSFEWKDSDGRQIASYVTRPHDGARALFRQFCVGENNPTSEILVVRGIDEDVPRVDCDPVNCVSVKSVLMRLKFESGRSVDLSASRRSVDVAT